MFLFSGRATVISLAFAAFAVTANAQQVKFSLPFEAHWTTAVLTPGEYTLSPVMTNGLPHVFSITGNGHKIFVLANPENTADASGKSYLEIEDAGGVKVVRDLHWGFLGTSFSFAMPKAPRAQMASLTTPRQVTKIAVLTKP